MFISKYLGHFYDTIHLDKIQWIVENATQEQHKCV